MKAYSKKSLDQDSCTQNSSEASTNKDSERNPTCTTLSTQSDRTDITENKIKEQIKQECQLFCNNFES
jgi:hypothetical protein